MSEKKEVLIEVVLLMDCVVAGVEYKKDDKVKVTENTAKVMRNHKFIAEDK